MTSIDLKLELPDKLARDAKAAGLLTSRALARLLREGLRREALRRIREGTERVREAGIEPLSLAEIQREVDEVRKRK
jgi:post-segregation antitoxin (ccd killing protein)